MKKLINDPRHIVREALEGLVASTGHLALVEGENIVVQRELADPQMRRVAVISGGGSGHEPAHAGYVGAGMLTAAVAGDVFTSPSVDAVLAGIRCAAGPAGALLIVKNYTGDRLNFGLAAELAREAGIPVEIVLVADDVSLRDRVPAERRRGIAGTVLVHKIAGAAAARGWPLEQVAAIATRAASAVGSMGVGLGACTVPSAGTPSFTLGEDEIEYGLGIHGEKGVERVSMKPADAIVDDILGHICEEIPAGAQRVALLVNGLGATPPLELQIVARHAIASLRARGLTPVRAWVGNFMTALEMPGVSLSVLPVDEELLELLDAPSEASAWMPSAHLGGPVATVAVPGAAESTQTEGSSPGPLTDTLRRVATDVAHALIAAETELGELDGRAGDGDLGASMARGAQAILDLPDAAYHTPAQFLAALAQGMRRAIAGSSGPFYAIGLLRASRELAGVAQPSAAQWHAAFAAALAGVMDMGGAKPGDRTMVDALAAASEAWAKALSKGAGGLDAFHQAAQAAQAAADQTANMQPRLGRASYLGQRAVGVPDGGAVAVSLWLDAIHKSLDAT
ncbi:dihydroxyacetone kinase family protein [Bordetella sp. 15P40C-2]|uniref:dihydroxyacetone kinase family protein n=1 Tax=Bordetella sp. 15P40C-2 TaxID=2572246 RepID=UPI001325995A|nr:dihydroxyacetone kinase family protein [Bordetella sp. 15P40C-2]MVW72596.1 dihydroxyacetone kinase subunit DhaK [Bordetella sp. 15P40C-2]